MSNKLSPMMEHYKTLKESYPDTILLYRLGDFYEMFFEDALICRKVLDLT
jgi:DNA mismatch repair protein MutS